MTKTSLFAALLLVGIAGAAEAGGSPGTLGVGAEYQLNGVGGASLNYDGGDWHAGGALGFADLGGRGNDDTIWQVAGRFYYHVHSTTASDFGVGGSIGILSYPVGGGNDNTNIYLEPGVQIRLFLAANVALSVSTGITLGVSDAKGVAITGGTVGGARMIGADTNGFVFGFGGGAGIHYYFF